MWIRGVDAAVAMVGLMGVSWALTLWAPFALIARCVSYINDVSRRESIASSRSMTPEIRPVDVAAAGYGSVDTPGTRGSLDLSPPLAVPSGISISNPDDRRPSQSTPLLHPKPHFPFPPPSKTPGGNPDPPKEITSAGTIMGLHNVFISSPQFLSTLLASIIFHFLNAGGRDDSADSIGGEGGSGWFGGSNIAVVLSVGGCGGIVAAYLTWKLKEDEIAEGGTIGGGD